MQTTEKFAVHVVERAGILTRVAAFYNFCDFAMGPANKQKSRLGAESGRNLDFEARKLARCHRAEQELEQDRASIR